MTFSFYKNTCFMIMVLVFAATLVPFSCFAAKATLLQSEIEKTVAQDGSADYTTIQAAINDCKAFPYSRITIFVKKGVYHEKVKVHEWNCNITLQGESKTETIISYDDYFSKTGLGINSTFYTYTMLVEGDNFMIRDFTIENTSGEVGQAVALSVHANNAAVINCILLGHQDTLYVSGTGFKNYFQDCFIQGTTDFIFGSATAYFQNCVLHSLRDSYITAASTPQSIPYGFVFNHCTLSGNENVTKVYLGRPWRIYAKTVFLNCSMSAHIAGEGWHNWSKQEAEKNTFYAEYNNTGLGYNPKQRVHWSHQLKSAQAKKYTIENCLGTTFFKMIQQYNKSGV